jgi:hypothetical protein
LVDVPLAGDRLPIGADRSYDIVAEARPATSFALFDTATLATRRLVREVRQENRVHRVNGMQSGSRIGMEKGPLTGVGTGLSR